jgi:hypothetical protein
MIEGDHSTIEGDYLMIEGDHSTIEGDYLMIGGDHSRIERDHSRIEGGAKPIPEKNDFRPTPEEFAMRGLSWADTYLPTGWFSNKNIEYENQYKEEASMNTHYRPECILWLGCQLAKLESGKWNVYKDRKFLCPKSVLGDSEARASEHICN